MKHLLNWKKFNENLLGFGEPSELTLGPCPKNETPVQAKVDNEYQKSEISDDDYEANAYDNGDMYLDQDTPESDPDYLMKQKEECERYVELLMKRFVVCHNVNISAKHDSYEGSDGYYEAVVKYDDNDTEQKMQAHFIEDNLPQTWDDMKVFSADEYRVWYDDNLEDITYSEFE